ncbi:MAG: flagellar hook-associated protein FlgK [Deltaproteobacteria bacterium]|nr:flagellar hook-associated protein FlgK [Deltaproteobacteria bacterium]
MSLLSLINIGKSTLYASQAALNVAGHNIANVNTPGYTRQEVVLETASPIVPMATGYMGIGVAVKAIERRYDRFIETQLLGQETNLGKSTAMDQVFGQVEQVFNDSAGAGISESLNALFDAWQSLSANPEDTAQRTVLLSKAASLAGTLRRMDRNLVATVGGINDDISSAVERIGAIATDIALLNGRIVEVEAGGTATANDLRDSRDMLVKELSGLADIETLEDATGSLNVFLGMRSLVDGQRAATLSTATESSGDLRILLDGKDMTAQIAEGRLGGLLASRETVESETLPGLRLLAAALTKEMNLLHRAGYGLDGTTGNDFFAPLSLSTTADSAGATVTSATVTDPAALTLSEYSISIGAGNAYTVADAGTGATVATGTYASGGSIAFEGISVVITGTVAEGDAFTVSPLTDAAANMSVSVSDSRKIAAASAASALPGDNSNALAIAGLADAAVDALGDDTFSAFYSGLVTEAGAHARDAADLMTFDVNLKSELVNRRESASGVSIDEEATKIIAFQRMFEAGARIIKITDELFQTVLQL